MFLFDINNIFEQIVLVIVHYVGKIIAIIGRKK